MSLKITVSYTEPREYGAVLRLLMPIIRKAKRVKDERGEDGKYKRAYIICDVARREKGRGKQHDMERIAELLQEESPETVKEVLVFIQSYLSK